ncbi:MAG: NAD(P)H-dependent oxidoreductase [Cyclobacteriaceae bacterium]
MITIVCGTNRKDSITLKVVAFYEEILKSRDQQTSIINLEDLPDDFIKSALYENTGMNDDFNKFQKKVDSCEKFVFVTPEYNGSFPGVLKAFIDGMRFPGTFEGKKCALVGLSAGTQGAALAMSHLTDIFNYLGMNVLANKPRLPLLDSKMNGDRIIDSEYIQLLEEQADQLISF